MGVYITNSLEPHEVEVVLRMYDEYLIGPLKYKPIEVVASKIGWVQIATKYDVKKDFKSIMHHLKAKQLVSDWGKSMAVVSLTKYGAAYAFEEYRRRRKGE